MICWRAPLGDRRGEPAGGGVAGNHDPAVADAVYHRGVLAEVAIYVLGITHDEAIDFPAIELEIWGARTATTAT